MNYLAIGLASVVQFVLGMIWYGALFGKLWGKIHGFDRCSKEEQQAMMAKMGPYYALQFVVTVVTTAVLATLINHVQAYSAYVLALLLWIGFVVPVQISDVIFGGTQPRWMLQKIGILSGASLLFLLTAVLVLQAF